MSHKKVKLILLLVCTAMLVAACGVDYSGQYGGLSDLGIFVSMTLYKDGSLETNILGFPINGSYTIDGNILTVKLVSMGYSQTIQGRIINDTIKFSDTTLKKGVTSVDISEVSNLFNIR